MSILKLKRGPSTRLNNVPVQDGSIIVTKDTHELFIDFDTTRVSMSPKKATDEDIIAMFNGESAVASTSLDDEVNSTVINGVDTVNVQEF